MHKSLLVQVAERECTFCSASVMVSSFCQGCSWPVQDLCGTAVCSLCGRQQSLRWAITVNLQALAAATFRATTACNAACTAAMQLVTALHAGCRHGVEVSRHFWHLQDTLQF